MILLTLRSFLAGLLLSAALPAQAMDPPPHPAETAIRDYVMTQTRGSGNRIEVAVDPLPQSILQRPCSAYVPALPAGTRLWGRSVVALNCAAPQSWVVYAPVNIGVYGRYLKTARAIASGQALTTSDFVVSEGDLTGLPDGTFTQAGEALGLRTRVGLAAGLPLGRHHVVVPPVVKQGDPVRVVAKGPGFAASSEGRALANAAEGETVRVRMPSGQTVTGVAQKGGIVELPN
ncbi:MAG TPA: flagellar basal body P-ring formation chaperone FlgA [Rhodocyclaceae bacterium]